MQKSIAITFTILVSWLVGFSQNYQTIYSNRTAYYTNEYSNIECIRIDSAKYETDSIISIAFSEDNLPSL